MKIKSEKNLHAFERGLATNMVWSSGGEREIMTTLVLFLMHQSLSPHDPRGITASTQKLETSKQGGRDFS